MLSEINNDSLAAMIKTNPQFEAEIKAIIDDNKKTTSMLVHELRNPLCLLKGTVQYIEQKHPEAATFKYWDQMQQLLDDMDQIMSDASLLNTCNYLHKEDTDLFALVKNMVSSYMPQAITEKIELSLNIEPDCEEYFKSYSCDSIKMKQVFGNLIKNAFEAVEPGNFIHIVLKYLPGEAPSPAKLSFEISNNGPPIPEYALKDIFVPFITYKKGGTGVGLAIVKKVIDLHYGNVCVSSDESLTSFTVQLPL
jgi:signal transduction histidine kinase